MQELQLYIEGQRIDLFKDETVSLTQTIQNVKDVAKIFTSFTKTFNIPASKTNNKLFKHYYNFDIVGGFDARIKKDSRIELNSIPYKMGRIRLEGVALKNNVPYTYKITFFGNTVELPDILGEDTLASLDWVGASYSIPYTPASINSYFGTIGNGKILCPLITHTQRLYYNSSQNIANSGNLYYQSGSVKGVVWNQLKFAVRLYEIILEIEIKYTIANGYTRNIQFSRDFFSTINPQFYKLYMWLHRKSGDVQPSQQVTSVTSQVVFSAPNNNVLLQLQGNVVITPFAMLDFPSRIFDNEITFTTTSNVEYVVTITLNGNVVFQSTSAAGTRSFNNQVNEVANGGMTVSITSETSITFSNIDWEFNGYYQSSGQASGFSYTDNVFANSFPVTNDFDFLVSEQIPEMSVISFLTSLFKMFSLVAYVDQNDVIVIRPLEATDASNLTSTGNLSFYTNADLNGNDEPTNYNISSFIDTTKSAVNVALPYNEIVYGYEGTGSILAKQHNQLSGSNWGALSYSGAPTGTAGGVNFNASTEIYKVLIPFEHFKYERLIDVNNSADTEIQWGWSVNENQQPYIGKPLIFYAITRQLIDEDISLVMSATQAVPKSSYIQPSNSLFEQPAQSKININFNNEINEYTRTTDFTDTLFKVYHSEYIIDVFNTRRRITQVSAYLPLRILFDFELNDTFEINSQKYIINSITTNLQSGKSSMELLNKV
jgi:hypothetical protein